MADTSVKELVMVFETQTPGRYYTMRYRDPKDGITTEEIQSFMQWVIDQTCSLHLMVNSQESMTVEL